MVFFTCSHCGVSLKKAQVEKHRTTQCRMCEMVSCMDCGKDFQGDDFKAHTKCISEVEKYSGVDYKPKPGANKGEQKQEQWIQRVQTIIKTANIAPDLKNLLKQMVNFDNIPRKQSKFQKFLENSMKVHNKNLIERAWKVFAESNEKTPEESPSKGNNDLPEKTGEENNVGAIENGTSSSKKKKHKKKKKDDSELEAPDMNNSAVDADAQEEKNEVTESSEVSKKKKKKKSKEEKHENSENVPLDNNNIDTVSPDKDKKRKSECDAAEKEPSPKKKKKKHSSKDAEASVNENGSSANKQEDDQQPQSMEISEDVSEGTPQGKKLKVEKLISAVLQQTPDKEMSLKKLKKKVVNEFNSSPLNKDGLDESTVIAKIEKKISSKQNKYLLVNDRVKLV